MKRFATITAICAAISSFLFAFMSLTLLIDRGDLMLIPFAIIGFVGSAVMWANRK